MRNYRIINDYKVMNKPNLYVCNMEIKDLKSNLYYLVWVDDYSAICFDRNSAICFDRNSAICFDRNPSNPKGVGYMRLFGETFVFEEDDLIPYIYS